MIKSEGGGERYAPGILKELVLMFMLQQMQNKISDSKSALQRIRRKATDKMIMRSPIQSSVFGYPMKNQKRKQQNLHMIQCFPRRCHLLLLS
jgi:hypothetical protein